MAALEVVKSMKESLSRRRIIDTKHEAEFTFAAPKAKKVCIAGNFNDWNSTSMPMRKSADGTWKIKLKLSPGKYEYKFVVDGIWVQETTSSETALILSAPIITSLASSKCSDGIAYFGIRKR